MKAQFADLSHDQIRSALRDELRTRYGVDEYGSSNALIQDVFDEYAVFEMDGKLYRVSYTVAGTDVTLGTDVTEVITDYTPVDAANMAALCDQWIEIFRAGDYGEKGKYTVDELKALAASYNPEKHEAPVVIGHPKVNPKKNQFSAPAYGWVKSLKVDGDTLLARFHQVDESFEKAVEAGRYKKRSVALQRTPAGALMLRHVGFLGAAIPEVKGLRDARFGDGEFQVVEFCEEETMEPKEVERTTYESIRKFFAELGRRPVPVAPEAQFSEAELNRRVEAATKPLLDKLTSIETKFSEREKTEAKSAQSTAATQAVADLKAAGKWLPAFDRMGAPQIFAALAVSSEVVTFGEGDKKTEKPVLKVFSDFLSGLKEIVPAGEIAGAAAAAKKGGKVLNFNATAGIDVKPESIEFAEAAQRRANEKKIDLGLAMKELRSEGWQPTAAAAGAV